VDPDIRKLVERFWEAFNTRDLSRLEGLLADDYVNHAALPGTPPGPEGQGQVNERLWSAFPDAHFEIEHVAQDGDTVLCVGTMTGTHEGELFGVPGSGKRISWAQCHVITVREGQASAHRGIRDDVGLLRQMGALPG
jgi:steroid delta-isomerase-like uncharacterized protein